MNLIRIDHVSLDVADRDRSLAWYAEVLALRADGTGARPDEPVFVGAPRARLGLFAERAPGLRHIALATDAPGQQEVLERLDRLAIPCLHERHRDHDSVYFRDPDGVVLEVMVSTA